MKNTFTNYFKATLWSVALVFGMMACAQMEDLTPNSLDAEVAALMDGSNPFARMSGDPAVAPVFWNQGPGGNATCDDAASTFEGVDGFEMSSGRNNYEDGQFVNEWPEGLTVQVIDGKVYWEYIAPEGFCLENMSVIVKGGPAANIYNYESGIYHDGGLVAPVVVTPGRGKNKATSSPAGLSNLTFCFNLTDAPEAPVVEESEIVACFDPEGEIGVGSLTATATVQDGATLVWYNEDGDMVTDPSISEIGTAIFYAEAQFFNGCVSSERTAVTLTLEDCSDTDVNENCTRDTAFAGTLGDLLDNRGWFYLMSLDGDGSATGTLFAGRTKEAGTVTINTVGGKVVVSVVLKEGFSLQSGENWYVHGYDEEPKFRPVGGRQGDAKAYAKGNATSAPFTVELDKNGASIFAVHVNVQECKPASN
ncbi:hypothetical protein SAMN05421761_10259 [Belliella pelovolcani]|uniref:Ig-like domain-containing protein n=2 Tax=Belliella pelovolcani TaxID=529505 RepID=A0A1N7KGG9_9BACT|nr:hypothetical protein SAMN05421761_10259 [Belliella pelovolcani]